jgi:hypothetical protein
MTNPFQHFLLFIWAVLNQVVTLAAGCAITVLIGIIEKRVLKRPISLKLEIGILLAFVFFACFQTWRDQYSRGNGLQTTLSQKPSQPQVQVNVPPAQVIITPSTPVDADLTGFLQIAGIEIVTKIPVKDSPISIDTKFTVKGTQPIHGTYMAESAILADYHKSPDEETERKAEQEIRKLFKKEIQKQKIMIRETKLEGRKFGVGNGFAWNTVNTSPLTEEQAAGIMNGQTRLYVMTWAIWKDSRNKSGDLETCAWLQPPLSMDLTKEQLVWHVCVWAP